MLNFDFKNPTKIIFGKNTIIKLSTEIPKEAKVLMLYGEGSIKKNGIYEQVTSALSEINFLEFGGIPANPEYAILLNALALIKKEKITYLLAVGGASVIDATKFLASAALFNGVEPWDIIKNKIRTETAMPFGTVLTLPATGSEMNSGAVITRKETGEKLGMGGPGLFPQFSILDPEVIKSIPPRQIQNGIIDAFTHALEQYITYPIEAKLQDRFTESIMQTLIEIAPIITKDTSNYKAACDFMWCCTMALNGLIQKGVPTDWALHTMAHELTAIFGIDHARTLTIIAPSYYQYKFENKKEKLAQYGQRVWGITEGSIEEKATQAIAKTTVYFKELGMPIKLSECTQAYEGTAEKIAATFEKRGWNALGEKKDITPSDVKDIITMSY